MPITMPLSCIICYSPPDTSTFAHALLQAQFSRIRRTLLLIARKVLNDDEKANEVVANCFARAYKLFGTFADEADLRRWLVRLAIDEALQVVQREEMAAVPALVLSSEQN